jgi:hypothetical protein
MRIYIGTAVAVCRWKAKADKPLRFGRNCLAPRAIDADADRGPEVRRPYRPG